jgi:DNA-binding transcriptional LysR family regulator
MDRFAVMETFVRVAELGNLSAAARELGLTQPAVSQQMAGLERRLGTRLFNRSTRSLALSEAGEAYYVRAKHILEEVDEAEDTIAGLSGELKGSLRLQAPIGLGQMHLAPLIVDFHQQHPGLSVELILDDHIADLIGDGVDLAVRLGTLKTPNLVARKLGMLRRLLVASPDYVAEHGSPETPADLTRHAHVRFSWVPTGEQLTLLGPQGPVTIEVRSTFLANNAFVLIEAIRAGLGIGGVQAPLVQDLIWKGELVEVMHNYAYPAMEIHAVYPSRRFLPRKVRALVDHLVARLPQVPGLD